MHKTDLIKIGGIATTITIIGIAAIAINQQTQTEPADETNTPTTTTQQTITTPQTETGPLELDQVEDELFNPYPTGDETGETLAAVFGCGWWAKPIIGETLTELANRMQPVISPEIYNDITELRNTNPDPSTTIEAIPGVITTEPTTTNPNGNQTTQYNVSCNTVELDNENKPTGQQAQTSQIFITQTPGGETYISKAILAGLTLPLP